MEEGEEWCVTATEKLLFLNSISKRSLDKSSSKPPTPDFSNSHFTTYFFSFLITALNSQLMSVFFIVANIRHEINLFFMFYSCVVLSLAYK